MLESLISEVLEANRALPSHGLVKLTTGNVSGIDREQGLMVIKPSGVAYAQMTPADMVVLDLDGNVVAGERRPSSDAPTHLALYRELETIGGVVHTHSAWATAWAQAGRPIPVLGTTHADLSPHPVPVTRGLAEQEIWGDYEDATGRALVEAVASRDAGEVPWALVRGHGPFCWGPDPTRAVEHAVTLEQVARMALLTSVLAPDASPLPEPLRRKHHEGRGPRPYGTMGIEP